MNWNRLSRRSTGQPPPDVLHEGAPPHLKVALLLWLREALDHRLLQRLALRLGIALDPRDPMTALGKTLVEDPEQLLDAVDFTLALMIETGDSYQDYDRSTVQNRIAKTIIDLSELLHDGRSAWRVAESGTGLERRVDPTMSAAAAHARSTAPPSAGECLATAWAAAFGRPPDHSKAYSEAVKAVEAASHSMVVPKDGTPTLGKTLRALRDQAAAGRWELVVPDKDGSPASVDPLADMIGVLWDGHRDRHGHEEAVPISQEAAEAAVHLAVMLVAWFSNGTIRRR